MATFRKFWLVRNESEPNTYAKKHCTKSEAEAAALRLSGEHEQQMVVLEAVRMTPPEWHKWLEPTGDW